MENSLRLSGLEGPTRKASYNNNNNASQRVPDKENPFKKILNSKFTSTVLGT